MKKNLVCKVCEEHSHVPSIFSVLNYKIIFNFVFIIDSCNKFGQYKSNVISDE